MMSANRRKSEMTGRKGFQQNLELLDGVTSGHLWFSALMILLLPTAIVLLSYPLPLVTGLLGTMWALNAFMLFHLRGRLKAVRKGLIAQMDGATKSHVRAEQFYGLSILDPLTGLYNRRFGETRLEEEIAQAEKSGDPLLVLAIDFDRFKEINDKHGHAAGDMALQEFSRRLQRAIRACDVPIRVGGDEFLVVLPDCPPDKIELILSRMGSIAFALDGKQIPVFFSYGMAQYQFNDTPETIIKRADERLYAEKAKRKTVVDDVQTSATKSATHKKNSGYPSVSPLRPQPVERMRPERVRRSSRIPKEIAVRLIGSDLQGKFFSEQTNTVELSRHGAGVVTRQKLAPGQEIIIRHQETNKEAEVRIVRIIGSKYDTHTYGLALVNPTIDIWGIEFPPVSESEKETSHLLFECSGCEGRETVYNSDSESDRFTVNKSVVRSCRRCGTTTTWKQVLADDAGTSVTETGQELACEVAV